jgi:hypothetical protein
MSNNQSSWWEPGWESIRDQEWYWSQDWNWDWNQEWYWSQDWDRNQEWNQGHGSADAASSSWDPAGLVNAAQEEPLEETGPVPNHSPPGKGCRRRRRDERDTQTHTNLTRQALNAPVSDASLQTQIKWERLVRAKQTLAERTLPGVLAEVQGYAKAQETYGRLLVAKAAAIAEGMPIGPYMVPPPTAPWLAPSPPAPVAQLEGLSTSSSVGRHAADAQTVFIPKTLPTPP